MNSTASRPRRRALSDEEREQRRDEHRQRLQAAAQALLTSEGWQRWIRVRASNGLSRYSARNQWLIALECHQRGIDPTYIAGFKAWLGLGRCVRRGERGLRILAPIPLRPKTGEEEQSSAEESEDGRPRVAFRATSVFDVSQTDPLPDTEPVQLEAPAQPICGDSYAHLIGRLLEHATTLGYTVTFQALPAGGPRGWCDPKGAEIVVAEQLPANAQVRVLVHELAHAHGIGYEQYGREQAEVLVECVTYCVLGTAGLDTTGETIPYVAGWGETGALDAIAEFAQRINDVAAVLEAAIADPDTTAAATGDSEEVPAPA